MLLAAEPFLQLENFIIRTHYIYQTGIELRNLPVSVSQVPGLKTYDTIAQIGFEFLRVVLFPVKEGYIIFGHPYKCSDVEETNSNGGRQIIAKLNNFSKWDCIM